MSAALHHPLPAYQVLLKLHIRARASPSESVFQEQLFVMLRHARRKKEADAVEGVIWNCFMSHMDERVRELLDEGVHLLMKGRYEEAAVRFSQIISLDERFAEGYNKRATSYFMAGTDSGVWGTHRRSGMNGIFETTLTEAWGEGGMPATSLSASM